VKRAADLLADGVDPDEYGPELLTCSTEPLRQVLKTPLLTAVMNDDAAMVRLLLFENADVASNPALVLWVALENSAHRALAALLENGLQPPLFGLPFDLGEPLSFAVSRRDVEAVRVLLVAGVGGEDADRLLGARRRASGPAGDEIRRLIDRALEAREDVRGRLSLSAEDSGGQLSLTHQGLAGEVSLSDDEVDDPR
jgi:hypothetical protein